MDPQILAAVLTVALTIAAGVVGFLFREYRSRIRPFMAITAVKGDMRQVEAVIDIPVSLIAPLKDAFYIEKLDSTDKLGQVVQASRDAAALSRRGPEFIRLVDRLVAAADSGSSDVLQDSLAKIFSGKNEDMWIRTLLTDDVVTPPRVNRELPVVIQTYPSNENDGCVWLGFPKAAIWFGSGFDKHKIIKEKCQPLIDLIERLDMKGLAEVFRSVKKSMEAEITIAKDVAPLLENLLDENSQWAIEIYLANLGPNPFLVNKEGVLHVADETGARYDEACKLVLMDKEGNYQDAKSPLVVGGEKDKTFALFTQCVQGKMKRGQAFREAFASKSANCFAEFNVQKVGIIRDKKLKTPRAPFREPNER